MRKRLFRQPVYHRDVLIESTDSYQHWNSDPAYQDHRVRGQERYAKVLQQSSFFLCPRGAGASSIRLFEVMQAGAVPVIVSDRWIPNADIPWHKFALFVRERDLPNLDTIIRRRAAEAPHRAKQARHAWEKYCNHSAGAATLARCLRRIQQRRDERWERRIRRRFVALFPCWVLAHTSRKTARSTVLRAFALSGRRFPFRLNRTLSSRT